MLATDCMKWAVLPSLVVGIGCGGGDTANGPGDGSQAPLDEQRGECGPLTSSDVAERVGRDLPAVLHRAVASWEFTEGAFVLGRVVSMGESGAISGVAEGHADADELGQRLVERYLAAGNVEVSTPTLVTYRLKPELACSEPVDPADSDAVEAANNCVEFLSEHAVRLVVDRTDCEADEALRLRFSVDEPNAPMATLLLAATWLKAEIDVARGLQTLQRTGNFEDGVVVDSMSHGRITGTLDTRTESRTEITFGVPEGLLARVFDAENELAIELQPAPQAFRMVANSTTGIIDGEIALDTLRYSTRLDAFVRNFFQRELTTEADTTQVVDLEIAGIRADFEYVRGTDSMQIDQLSLGNATSRARLGYTTLLTVDVNRASARSLDVAVTANADRIVLALNPGFDLELAYAMAPLAGSIVELQRFALDDRVRFRTDGAFSTTLFDDEWGTLNLVGDVDGALLRVETGSLHVTSTQSAGDGFSVLPGQCLLRHAPDEREHEMLREMGSGACP